MFMNELIYLVNDKNFIVNIQLDYTMCFHKKLFHEYL